MNWTLCLCGCSEKSLGPCQWPFGFLFLYTHPLDYLVVPWLRIWKERKALSAPPMVRFQPLGIGKGLPSGQEELGKVCRVPKGRSRWRRYKAWLKRSAKHSCIGNRWSLTEDSMLVFLCSFCLGNVHLYQGLASVFPSVSLADASNGWRVSTWDPSRVTQNFQEVALYIMLQRDESGLGWRLSWPDLK